MNTPIVNAGTLYVSNLQLSRTGSQTISIAAGAARDITNKNDIIVSSAQTVNGATVGANGVDLAVLVASSFYAVYAIGDSTGYKAGAGILSLNTTSPLLPSGYDMSRRIGWVLTDGSANILMFYQYGSNEARTYYYDVAISALSGGSSTTFANVSLVASVPPIACLAIMSIDYVAAGSGGLAHFLPFGSSATNGIVRYNTGGTGAAEWTSLEIPTALNSGVPTIQYKVSSSDSLTLLTAGYRDNL